MGQGELRGYGKYLYFRRFEKRCYNCNKMIKKGKIGSVGIHGTKTMPKTAFCSATCRIKYRKKVMNN